ncbi:hypothetical protein AVEN_35476-1 [Araneus ventricosus]|uniref:Uncharacterized protein n=1 Tax=Araneus ventricosus TaxID=182803 RepID=A0A4Y2QPL6_ARAVE|nr:hypothetical protein AVEN_35476-1 [Araneus ventricosus]
MARIAGTAWGLKQEHRRILYSIVAERMILHGVVPWTQNLASHQKKLLQMIQRKFLLFITGTYRKTPTAALQSITGILPLYITFKCCYKYLISVNGLLDRFLKNA